MHAQTGRCGPVAHRSVDTVTVANPVVFVSTPLPATVAWGPLDLISPPKDGSCRAVQTVWPVFRGRDALR